MPETVPPNESSTTSRSRGSPSAVRVASRERVARLATSGTSTITPASIAPKPPHIGSRRAREVTPYARSIVGISAGARRSSSSYAR